MTQNIDHKTLLWKTSFIKETKIKTPGVYFLPKFQLLFRDKYTFYYYDYY